MFAFSSENSRSGAGVPRAYRFRGLGWVLATMAALALCPVSRIMADDKPASQSPAADNKDDKNQVDPLKRPIPEAQKKANAKALKHELSKTYKKWLSEDVAWIITDEERKAFIDR